MRCVNCLHYKVCQYHIDEETTMTVGECDHFKHNDQYVKLPCYVGQSIWRYSCWTIGDEIRSEISEGKVSMLQQKADKSWKLRVSYNSGVSDFTLDDIGTKLFFRKEDAEEMMNRSQVE